MRTTLAIAALTCILSAFCTTIIWQSGLKYLWSTFILIFIFGSTRRNWANVPSGEYKTQKTPKQKIEKTLKIMAEYQNELSKAFSRIPLKK